MIAAFGPNANRYAVALGDIEAIVVDPQSIGEGYLEAVRRRERGETFYGMVLTDDPRVSFGLFNSEPILSQLDDFDLRRIYMDQLQMGALMINGSRADEQWNLDKTTQGIAVEFLALCDAMLVRSWTEYVRVAAWFDSGLRRPIRPVERILASSRVPQIARLRPDAPSIVIWAPQRPAVQLALHLHALAEFAGTITCVTAGGQPPVRTNATFLVEHDPRVHEALARAPVVLCVDPSDPADAVAFARQGFGVVAPLTSGAHEYAGEIVAWDALNARFLFTAVAVATARPAAVHHEPPRPPRAPAAPPRPAYIADVPLVSIITPTFNRPRDLRAMLTCIAAQTYPNIESIVVNDCGTPVDDIVAEFPFARLVNLEKNGGAIPATIVGYRQCKGEYIAYVPDDDFILPDHVDRLMNAVFRSGADVAHGTALLRFVETDGDGGWLTTGFNAVTFCETVAPSEALITSPVACNQMIVSKAAYDDVGWYRTDSDVADNEIHARLAPKYFYTFADHVTSEFRSHAGSLGSKLDFPTAMRTMYDVLHPTPDRPYLNRMRDDTIANVAGRPKDQPPFPASLTFSPRRT